MKKILLFSVVSLCSAIQLFAQNLWDVTDSGNHTYTSSLGTASNAWDNDPTTHWTSSTSPSTSFPVTNTVKLAAAKVITGYSVATSSEDSRDPKDFTLQGSTNGSTWVTLDTRTGMTWAETASTKIFSFSNSASYTYYRLRVTASASSGVGIAEIQLFTSVALSGKVFIESGSVPTPYVMNTGDVALSGVTVSLVNESGEAFATTTTNSSGQYTFTTAQLTGTAKVLAGDFSVIVTPPVGYTFANELINTYNAYASSSPASGTKDIDRYTKVADGAFPFLSYGYNFSGYSAYTVSNTRWDFGQDVSNAEHAGRGSNLAVNSIDFGLKKASAMDFSQFYPAGYTALPTNFVTVENNGTFGTYSPASYAAAHPTTPRFDWYKAKSNLYSAFSSATTSYTFKSTPGSTNNFPGTLIDEQTYTVTSLLGTMQGDVTSPMKIGQTYGVANAGGSLLNSYAGGWRKTYGANTGDVYDRFIAVNGSPTANTKLLTTNTFTLTANTKYAVFFNAKSANSSQQGSTNNSEIIVSVYRSGSSTPVHRQNIVLKAPTTTANDAPTAPWEYKYSEYTPSTSGTYYVVVEASTNAIYGNDFYFDNLGFYELRNRISISGTVWNDLDNSAKNTFNTIKTNSESGTNATELYAYLLDSNNKIIDVATVANNGTYTFTNAPVSTNGLTIALSDELLSATTTFKTSSLPEGWTNTTPLKTTAFDTQTSNLTGKDFGIEKLPESAISVVDGGNNPGGTTSKTVPAEAFQKSTDPANPNTGDAAPGTVTSIRITAFPEGASSLTVGSQTYTSSNWPSGGIVVPYTNGSGPSQTISVDPEATGATSVVIPFAALDNAGKEDPTPGSVTVNFTAPFYTISGTVFNDADGLLGSPAHTVNGTGTNAGGSLYANLVNNLGVVVGQQAVAANGTYSFSNVLGGNYTVVLNTAATGSSAANLPASWVNTGETIGLTAGTDGTVDGKIAVAVSNKNVSNVNFGIERLPESAVSRVKGGLNPKGTQNVKVEGASFQNSTEGGPNTSDPDGVVTSIRITQFPAGLTSLTIGSTVYTEDTWPAAGVVVPYTNGSGPAEEIAFDPESDGNTSIEIPFAAIDNAGEEDPTPGSVIVLLATQEGSLPVTLISFGAKAQGNQVVLTWRTTLEVNFSHFEVQRSVNGKEFESIATVKSLGHTGASYEWLDQQLPQSTTSLYYRLKSVDSDGTWKESKMVSINRTEGSGVEVWPNPFIQQLKVKIPAVQATTAVIRLYNATGAQVWQENRSLHTGANEIELTPSLPMGLYLLQVEVAGKSVHSAKLMKQ